MNSRLDEIQAAILSERIKWLKIFTDRRKEIANKYRYYIKNNQIEILAPPQEESAHVNHLFVIKSNKRDDLQKYLYEHNIQSLIHYPVPVHFQDSCKGMKRDPKGLHSSEQYVSQCLSIPCHPQMSNFDIEQVINAINRFR
jgi:dTDP-4-amino-4,6-dideoxygalactose transaminase